MAPVTPINTVIAGAGALKGNGLAGATITGGQFVYLSAATQRFLLADADGASAAVAEVKGMALHGATTDQPLQICTEGPVTGYTGVLPGQVYVLSATPGSMCPIADLVEDTDYVSVLGIGTAAGTIDLGINNSGVKKNLV